MKTRKILASVFMMFAQAMFAQATKYEYCCAIWPSRNACAFGDKPNYGHGCAKMTWTDGTPTLQDGEYISLVEMLNTQNAWVTIQSVDTGNSRILGFGFTVPQEWTDFVATGMTKKFTFPALPGREVIGLEIKSGTSDWVSDVLSTPMNTTDMDCENGVVMHCPFDPIFSYQSYKVPNVSATGAQLTTREECRTVGDWTAVRTEVSASMEDCPTTDTYINATHMQRKMVFVPEHQDWHPLWIDHDDIPGAVHCHCLFRTTLTQTIRKADDGMEAEVLNSYATASDLRLEVNRYEITQGKYEFVINASTTLDYINIKDCEVEAVRSSGRTQGKILPLVKTFNDVSKVSTEWTVNQMATGLPEMNFLQSWVMPKTEKRYKHQLVFMNGFTDAQELGWMDFTCTITACTKREDDKSRCQVSRRLRAMPAPGRNLRADEAMAVSIPDDCTGCPMPGADMSQCTASDTSMCPAPANPKSPEQPSANPKSPEQPSANPKSPAPAPEGSKIVSGQGSDTEEPPNEANEAARAPFVGSLAMMMLAGVVTH